MADANYLELLQRRELELSALLKSSQASSGAVELDQSRIGRLSRMDALQGQAVSAETRRRREAELSRVRAALRRLDAGTFGVCVECGELIGTKRLGHDPSCLKCIDCARCAES